MIENELYEYLKERFPKENDACEWKAFSNLTHSISGHKGDDVVSYVSAIANMEGGHLILGVEDKTLKILGIDNFHGYTPENLPHRLMGNCTHLSSEGLKVEEYTASDTNKTVWVLNIPKHLPRKPVIAHKVCWQRSGDNLIELTVEREKVILNETLYVNEDWSAGVCQGATINDLDPESIIVARNNFKVKNPRLNTEVDSWDDVTFLNKAKITINNKITRTAIILLGKEESEHYISPAVTRITWLLKDIANVEKDYEHFCCPFILSANKVFAKIRNLKYRYIKMDGLFPEEVDQYDPFSIREALNNCIAHQDYTKGGRINIIELDDQLIFTNSGDFLPGSIEKVIESDIPPSFYRNTFLSQAMVNLNMIDTVGSGIKRIFRLQRARFFPMPDFDLSGEQVKATITGKVLDIEYARTLAKHPDLSLDEIIMLDKVQKHKPLTPEEAHHLKSKGLIEGKRPHYFISAKVAKSAGQKAVYSKNRAFDKQYYLDLIIKSLREFGTLERRDIDELLIDKLSDIYDLKQKKNKITNLLSELRLQGKILNIGTDFKSKWILVEESVEDGPF